MPLVKVMNKEYYFPAWRAITIGVLMVFVGLLPVMIFSLIDGSVISGLNFFLRLFTGFPEIMIGLLDLLILVSGVAYLLKARNIVWLKLDEHGLHYLPWGDGKPSRVKPLFNIFYLEASMVFVPYRDLVKAELIPSKWAGDLIRLHFKANAQKDIRAIPFNTAQKEEIIALVNERCNAQ
ncbi:hypothetical protein LLH06_13220 [Mucilaginibacter daejeonensis]|uniref:hypothetical protein n=1 Tax=Mucilaginibacter daejeonensis TaxID=398049 RepID=UPI001D17200A|nr:hypothetical protein [Mucilaginibacter daejeonensis]UEG51922.1 hypothetical protein LLH06_13220 [Mucilaginibacter daejeonensis]